MIALLHPAGMSRNLLPTIGVYTTSTLQAGKVLNAEIFVNKRQIKFLYGSQEMEKKSWTLVLPAVIWGLCKKT
jgi:hypothetical protein